MLIKELLLQFKNLMINFFHTIKILEAGKLEISNPENQVVLYTSLLDNRTSFKKKIYNEKVNCLYLFSHQTTTPQVYLGYI